MKRLTGGQGATGPAGSVSAAGSGTAAAPGIAFASDPNTGIYNPGADQLAVATNGTQRLSIDANGNTHVIAVDGQLNLSKTGVRQYQFCVTGTGSTEGLAIRDESGATEVARFTQGGYLTVGGLRIKGTDTQNSIYQDAAFGLSSNNYITVGTGAAQTERVRVDSSGRLGLGVSSPASLFHLADAGNIQVGTTTGTKIGTATTQKIGFYNATPVVQPAAVANATTAVDVITQLNDLLAKLRTLGIIAT